MIINNKDEILSSISLMNELCDLAQKNNVINQELYPKYNVKRGLRNVDGTGVIVGLTEIGDVRSYVIDEGEKIPVHGKLLYRGIDVVNFVKGYQKDKRFGFEECCYLLLFGELPDKKTLASFTALLGSKRKLHEGFIEDMILKAPSKDLMNKLGRCILVSYSYDDNADATDIKNTLRQCIELIARLPAMAAYAYQAKVRYHDNGSLFIHDPRPELSTAENILHMLRMDSKYTHSEAEILDLSLVLHAEHGGGNNSTFVTHVVSSTGTDIYSSIAAAIGSLKGPLHGGANLKVINMMDNIKSNVKDWEDEKEISLYLGKIINREAYDQTGLIYGFGHAVYTLSDPRSILLRQKAKELAAEKGMDKEYNLYTTIEKLTPQVFFNLKHSDKPICANVDFYSGFVYNMLNIPREFNTPMFAIARIAGWCAHRIEELINGGRIIRPAYKNVTGKKPYIDIEDRE
jgi:citrate synthase